MAKKSSWNPIAFVPAQVTIIASAVYIALFVVLLWNHLTVPSAPSDPVPVKGINLTQAWLDLDFISDGFHPLGSRRNDVVRAYLAARVEEIVRGNDLEYEVIGAPKNGTPVEIERKKDKKEKDDGAVTIWAADLSNATFPEDWRHLPWTVYTESSNIVVYIKGKQDNDFDWRSDEKYSGHGGVLVNAHYDSVSTGYGATDDGVGVVTVLQLISYFTREGNQPDHGIVALLNNGEENGLYGAHSYLMHPMAPFAHTFLNLEGAGAGGKATLFRSTDAEITKFYAKSVNPFGSVISGDGFKQGFIRSGTDYSIFTGSLGMRGLDVAFFEPRARYHTDQDSARETNPDSVWHMLSTSLETMKALTSYSGSEFDGSVNRKGKLDLKSGSQGVWFDLFGRIFAVMKLNTLFALSITLLVAGPVLLIILEIFLVRNDKWYIFSRKKYLHSSDDDEVVHISGLRGFFRFPIAFIAATAAVVALGFLQTKINPNIIYSSEYIVWAEMLTAWIAVAWFILAGGDRIRPTALHRMFCLIWLYILTWLVLVVATVGENNFHLGSGYFLVIYNGAVFLALMISYLELFALPSKLKYAEHVLDAVDENRSRPGSRSSRTLLGESGSSVRAPAAAAAEDDEATESTSLLRGRDNRQQGTFAHHGKRRQPEEEGLEDSEDPFLTKAYGDEQAWSSSLPQWTWILQFLILAPINIILVGQIALLLTSAMHQTPADGNAVLPIYLLIAGFAVLILLPLTPFLHRFTYQLPTLLFLVFVGCLAYNLVAFPFSRDARMKHYFVQTIDLDSGKNNVTLVGLDGYVQDIIAELPSAAGRDVHCGAMDQAMRVGLQSCSWSGLAPKVVPEQAALAPYTNKTMQGPQRWLDYNVTFANNSASFSVQGHNTQMCRLVFDNPVSNVVIEDAATDPRSGSVAKNGSSQVRLFSRTWEKTFSVNVTWDGGQKAKGQTGQVACSWAESEGGEIPALDEIKRFEPVWSAVTKAGDGLVEGFKKFELR
ncbi:hypothetical protein LTR17_022966 [Elasticomyces elasticus]|nr:hypothetical protein LTR17_022966 [Elasticomyces elasticus]